MKQQANKIASLNPSFVTQDGVFAPARDASEVKVEFSNAEQEQVIATISSFDDCSTDSAEVDAAQGGGEYINSQTPQFLRAFDLSAVATVLEVSADVGNMARYLGEAVDSVECLRADANIAKASAYRCADLANVGTVNAELEQVTLPEDYYDLVVVADLENMFVSTADLREFLARLTKALSAEGTLCLISRNPTPVSAWFGDQRQTPYLGLYGTAANSMEQGEWAALLAELDLPHSSAHCFLPNAKNGKTLVAKTYLEQEAGALNHFYGAGLAHDEKVNEYLLFSELAKTQKLFDLCDDHLTIASRSGDHLSEFYNNDFSHFSGGGRRLQWRTLTHKPAGQAKVIKQRLHSDSSEATTELGTLVRQDLSEQGYQTGSSLAGLWLESLIQDSVNEGSEFVAQLAAYHQWLNSAHSELGDALYDILPFNLIVDEQGDYQVIDPEWQVAGVSSPEFVLFRALFWFGFHNRHLLRGLAKQHGLFSLEDFVRFGMQLNGYQSDLAAFSQIETQVQSVIEKQFNQDAIEETLRLPITMDRSELVRSPLPKAQVFWSDDAEAVNFENSVTMSIDKLDSAVTVIANVSGLDTSKPFMRVDPVDRGGFFHFSKVTIIDSQGGVLWSLDNEPAIQKNATTHNAVYCDSHLGSMYMAQNDDPQFIFDLSSAARLKGAASIHLTVAYSHSIDYSLAMQQLGQETLLQKQFIESQRNELAATQARYSELNDNFEFLKTNSEKQNDLIEQLMERIEASQARIEVQEQHAEDQQRVIDTQVEMMQRTKMARFKLFVARLRGQAPEVEAEQEPEPAAPEPAKAEKLGQTNEDYLLWIKQHELNRHDRARIAQEIDAMPLKPKFSVVVPVYNIEEEYLMMAINSMRDQLYSNWELCLVDDASPKVHIRPMLKRLAALDERIVVKLNKDNQGIAGASNDAVKMTTGDFVGLLDHDDELSIDALYENAKVINQYPDVGFIYSDEDKVTMEGVRVDPFFKPDYSPELLESQNYICHFSVISQQVVEKIGGFRLGFDGSQDHDIIMRAIRHAERVVHIPKVLYHWRKVPGSTAEVYDAKSYAWEAGRKAVAANLQHSGEAGEVVLGPLQGTYQVKRDIVGDPKVSIIIPFKDKPELLESCLDSILKLSTYQNYEVIGVSNNSEQAETHTAMQNYASAHDNIRFVEKNVPFNFSELCNYGVQQSSGEYVLLLNNDIEIRSQDWLERLLEHAQRDDIGAVGGKLFFPDGRIQHAGVVAGMHGAAGHSHLYFAPDDIGYYGSLMVTRNVSAVTGAMLMVSRKKYDQVAGLDEQNLAVAYNDVDLCLKLLDAGLRNIFTPFVHAVHYESASRGYEDNPEKLTRLEKERGFFVNKWAELLAVGDNCFNPNFDLDHFDFKIKI